jgi:lysophospholipase L1-like esterase
MSLRLATAMVLSTMLVASRASGAIKVACVGDSITVGARSSTPAKTYPAQLGALLGAAYQVDNFGVGGTTLLRSGDSPYVNTANYVASGTFGPDVVLIMLGTNDTKQGNWDKMAAFDGDYKSLVAHYAALVTHPKIYIVSPPPIFGPNPYGISAANLDNGVLPAVKKVAADTGTPFVDVYTALRGLGADFPDNVHPGDVGNAKIAETAYAVLRVTVNPDGGPPDAGPVSDARDDGSAEAAPPDSAALASDAAMESDSPDTTGPDSGADAGSISSDGSGADAGGTGPGGSGVDAGGMGSDGRGHSATNASSTGCSASAGAPPTGGPLVLLALWLLAGARRFRNTPKRSSEPVRPMVSVCQ